MAARGAWRVAASSSIKILSGLDELNTYPKRMICAKFLMTVKILMPI